MSKSVNKKLNIAINGFGRIGRSVFKVLLDKYPHDFNIVAINDLSDTKTLAHLLQYDTCYGKYSKIVKAKNSSISVGTKTFTIYAEKSPLNLPWKNLNVDIVLECTGLFRTKDSANDHIKAGAKKVIISAPGKSNGIKTCVLGVNEEKIKKTDKIISNASCTTNCLAPVTKVIKDNFGIQKAIMTTIHSYTADQRIVDGPHKDLRRARAAAENIVPTSTGAAIATTETIPQLKGNFDGMAIRVPRPVGSLCDIVFLTKKKTDEDKIKKVFKKVAKSSALKNIIEASEEPLVSSDIVGNPASAIVDLELTKVIGGDFIKIIAWYDNEWGYSNRLADLAFYLKKKKLI